MEENSSRYDIETTNWNSVFFPEEKREMPQYTEKLRASLSSFITDYSSDLEKLYQQIDQNLCRTWDVSSASVGMIFPFPTVKTLDQFFENHDFDVIYPIKLLTQFIHYIKTKSNYMKNKFFLKINTFGITITEIENEYPFLDDQFNIPHGEIESMYSDFIPVLQDLAEFLHEYFSVGLRYIEFLAYLYSSSNKFNYFFNGDSYGVAFEALGHFLTSLHTLERLISKNEVLQYGYSSYMEMLDTIGKSPTTFGTNLDEVEFFERNMEKIKSIVNDRILTNFMRQIDSSKFDGGNKNFVIALENYLKSSINRMRENSKTLIQINPCDSALLFQVLSKIKGSVNNKLLHELYALYEVYPVYNLYNNVSFSITEFLSQSHNVEEKKKVDVQKIKENFQNSLHESYRNLFERYCSWQSSCEERLYEGILIANEIRQTIVIVMSFYDLDSIPGPLFKVLCNFTCLLKSIQSTLFLNTSQISHNLHEQFKHEIESLDKSASHITSCFSKKEHDGYKESIMQLVNLYHDNITQYSPEYSQICLKILVDIFARLSKKYNRNSAYKVIGSMNILSNYDYFIKSATDTSFLVNYIEIIQDFVEICYSHFPRRISFLALTMNDIGNLFVDDPVMLDRVQNHFVQIIREYFIKQTAEKLDEEIKLNANQHHGVSERNPLKNAYVQFDKYLTIPPFRVMSKMIDIKYEIEYIISRDFYNSIACHPSDWEIYTELGDILKNLYDINLIDCRLPGSIMDQDIDFIEIMRKLSKFVASYNYDLNDQIFIQRKATAGMLRIVGVKHAFSSYRCHGIGIMNTTVEYAYRFLKKRIIILSQLLFNENIASRLYREIQYFEENKTELDGLWSYKRAKDFVNDMKKLSQQKDESTDNSWLDQLRVLITHIGNVLGFVRLVKSGGNRYVNRAMSYIYDCESGSSLQSFAENMPEWTVKSCESLDEITDKVINLFKKREPFFKHLVDAMLGPMRDKKNEHLQRFYAILPPLMISYVDHILKMKDEVQKKNENASFSDDGFPMGVTYMLKLLDQYELFDSIHWFKSVEVHLTKEKERLGSTKLSKYNPLGDKGKKQTAKIAEQLTMKEINEYILLETTVNSARTLFT